MEKTMDKIVALCKNRGFIFPVSYTHLVHGGILRLQAADALPNRGRL